MLEFDIKRREPPMINLSALIDIAFILVIFIVLGATFQRVRAVDVDLPAADGRSNPDSEGLVITVPRAGPVLFGDREVADEDIDTALEQAKGHHGSIVLMADRDAAVERAVVLLSRAQAHGFTSVSFATNRKERDRK